MFGLIQWAAMVFVAATLLRVAYRKGIYQDDFGFMIVSFLFAPIVILWVGAKLIGDRIFDDIYVFPEDDSQHDEQE